MIKAFWLPGDFGKYRYQDPRIPAFRPKIKHEVTQID
jgi:hypothetical protein